MTLALIGYVFACKSAEINEEELTVAPVDDVPVVTREKSDASFDDVLTTKKLLDRTIISAYAKTYNFHEGNGELLLRTFNDDSSPASSLGYDHVILARDWIGSVRWHPVKMNQCVFEFHIPANSLDPNPTRLRKRLGLDGVMTKADRLLIKTHMLSRPQLWAEKNPMITFTSDKCASSEGRVELNGMLTIRGVSKPIKTELDLTLLEDGLIVNGEISVNHTDFGLKPYHGLMGLVAIKNIMKISMRLDSRGI